MRITGFEYRTISIPFIPAIPGALGHGLPDHVGLGTYR